MSVMNVVACLFVVSLTFPSVTGRMYDDEPHTVYDLTNSSYRYEISCGESFSKELSVGEIDWYEWHTESKYSSFTVSTCGSSATNGSDVNKWLYVLYDVDEKAEKYLLTMNDLVGVCYECGISDTHCEELEFTIDDSSHGRYWFGVDEDYTITFSCTVSDRYDVTEEELIIMIGVAILVFSLWILLICYVYRSTIQLAKKFDFTKKFTFSTEMTEVPHILKFNETEEKSVEPDACAVVNLVANNVRKDPVLEIIDYVLLPAAEEGGLDVYQMLAFRRLDARSHVVQHLFKHNERFLTVSRYHFLVFVCLIVGMLQVFGLTITLYSVVAEYFDIKVDHTVPDDHKCEWQTEAWEESWAFKVLAFLWSIVISVSVGIYTTNVRKNGINPMLKQMEHSNEFSTMLDFSILQIGVIINLYALLISVGGSFFLIYASEGGSDALDMILNAVALFFILEVDDMLVSHKDEEDLKKGIELFRKEYLAGKDRNYPRAVEYDNKQCCSKRRVVFWVKFGRYFRFFVLGVISVCALFAPWAIMICW